MNLWVKNGLFFGSAVTSQGLNYPSDYVWSRDASALICSIEPTREEIIRFSSSPTPTHSLLAFAPGLLYSSCAFRRLAYRVSAPAAWLFSVNLSLSSCHAVSLSGGSEGMFPYIMMRRRGGGGGEIVVGALLDKMRVCRDAARSRGSRFISS